MGKDVELERRVSNEDTMVGSQVSNAVLVQQLLHDMGTAMLRPLFAELALQDSSRSHTIFGTSRKDSSVENKQRSWIEVRSYSPHVHFN